MLNSKEATRGEALDISSFRKFEELKISRKTANHANHTNIFEPLMNADAGAPVSDPA